MIQSPLLKKCCLTVLVFFLLAGNGVAAEEYDTDTYGPEEPIVWTQPASAIFDHKIHTMDVELECSDCHDDIFSMESKEDTNRDTFTMAAMAEGEFCGACHNGDDAFDSTSECGSCHFAPTEKIIFTKPVKSVVFDHSIHVAKAKLSCESCHKEVFSMKQGGVEDQQLINSDNAAEKRQYLVDLHKKYCGTCHDSSQAFGYLTRCTVCHIGVKGLRELSEEEANTNTHEKNDH